MTRRYRRSPSGHVRIKSFDTAKNKLENQMTRIRKFIPKNNVQVFNSGYVIANRRWN